MPKKEVNSMEEKNTTTPNENEKNETKKVTLKQDKKGDKASFADTVADYKAEFKKIIWPKRDELSKKTVTVIMTSLLIGVIIFCMDTIYTTGYDYILSLLG